MRVYSDKLAYTKETFAVDVWRGCIKKKLNRPDNEPECILYKLVIYRVQKFRIRTRPNLIFKLGFDRVQIQISILKLGFGRIRVQIF